MSTEVLPALPGLAWSVKRMVSFFGTKTFNVGGEQNSKAYWSLSQSMWEATYNVLRIGTINNYAYTEMQQLFGFFNKRMGGDGSFLYSEPSDNHVVGQYIGVGDGATVAFQLQRAWGAMRPETVLAPNLSGTVNVYLNGVVQFPASYTITTWETANVNGPGKIVFNSAPAAGQFITADFSYYFPCRFSIDQCEFEKMMQGYYQIKKLTFYSIK